MTCIIISRDVSTNGYSRPGLYLDFNRSAEARAVVVVVVDDDRILVFGECATFTFRSRAPLHPSANRNDTKNRLIRAREHDDEETSSHAFPSDNKGLCRLQHQFLFSYALSLSPFPSVSLSLRRRVEVRVTVGGWQSRREGRGSETRKARREMPRKSFPVESCSPLTISKGEHPSREMIALNFDVLGGNNYSHADTGLLIILIDASMRTGRRRAR